MYIKAIKGPVEVVVFSVFSMGDMKAVIFPSIWLQKTFVPCRTWSNEESEFCKQSSDSETIIKNGYKTKKKRKKKTMSENTG